MDRTSPNTGGQRVEITVAICTYNRANSLAHTLESFVRQVGVNAIAWELWVVDNKSTDHTRQICHTFADRLYINYLYEEELGLSAARNAMVRACRTEYLFFADDDVTVDCGWVRELLAAVKKYPDAGYFGGRILPRWDSPRPSWLKSLDMPLISSLYCYFDLGDQEHRFSVDDPTPFGASMGFRLAHLKEAGPFLTELGAKGLQPGRGDDAEMIRRFRRMGVKGVYLPNVVSFHEVNTNRFRLAYLYKYGVEKGRAAALMNSDSGEGRLWVALQYAAKGFLQLLKGRGDRFRQCVINIGIQRGLMLENRRAQVT